MKNKKLTVIDIFYRDQFDSALAEWLDFRYRESSRGLTAPEYIRMKLFGEPKPKEGEK